MLAQCFNRNFRKVMILSLVVATAMGFAITIFAVAAGQSTFAVAASESRPVPLKTNCNPKADKMLRLMDATAPVIQ
jgi:hypothetical protein